MRKEELALGLEERPSSGGADEEEDLIAGLCAFYKGLKARQRDAGGLYLPGGEWGEYLAERRAFYESLAQGDLEDVHAGLRGFWRNELGPIVSNYAYYRDLAAGKPASVERFMTLMSRDYGIWRSLYPDEPLGRLRVPEIGDPWGLSIGGELVAPQAFRFHNHSRQISGILSGIGKPVWAEIGGGYGGTAFYYLRNALEPGVTYVDFDLPETLAIAAYYLSRALPGRRIWLHDGAAPLTRESVSGFDVVLAPNYAIERLEDDAVDLFLNAFSFSEMPYPVLENYLRHVQRTTAGYFLQNNMDRSGVVNRGFERVPCSRYPIDPRRMKLLYKKHDLFQGTEGDYRECLYQRIAAGGA
ncbi:MAG: putative sugar O-methyltransferase [Elusimicrobia bacterium]|nr:putative sugar O-methyltransferase [Elusimicrobiota bacterium]